MAIQVKVDRSLCIGNGMCISIAPEVFKFEDGKSTVYHMDDSLLESVTEAEENCPIGAITILTTD